MKDVLQNKIYKYNDHRLYVKSKLDAWYMYYKYEQKYYVYIITDVDHIRVDNKDINILTDEFKLSNLNMIDTYIWQAKTRPIKVHNQRPVKDTRKSTLIKLIRKQLKSYQIKINHICMKPQLSDIDNSVICEYIAEMIQLSRSGNLSVSFYNVVLRRFNKTGEFDKSELLIL